MPLLTWLLNLSTLHVPPQLVAQSIHSCAHVLAALDRHQRSRLQAVEPPLPPSAKRQVYICTYAARYLHAYLCKCTRVFEQGRISDTRTPPPLASTVLLEALAIADTTTLYRVYAVVTGAAAPMKRQKSTLLSALTE